MLHVSRKKQIIHVICVWKLILKIVWTNQHLSDVRLNYNYDNNKKISPLEHWAIWKYNSNLPEIVDHYCDPKLQMTLKKLKAHSFIY